ncbi:MAG: hypothetical protein Q7T33_14880 [Dehalococcoidia bacterium]|nr:hypothetical protein [Dehalococcoidia bacterium]
MTSARRPLPTDIVALVSFDGRVYPNEAKPLDRLGLDDRPHPLETALEQWFSFATGKHTWVSVRGATIRGLISARKRAKRTAWEVEVLIDAADDEKTVLSLFGRMVAGVARLGAERVFLRLRADSPLVDTARAAGFFQYSQETLFRGRAGGSAEAQVPGLRSRGKHDLLGIYQLYNHTAPATVRAIEGATFREWQAAQEAWGGRTTDLLLEADGVIDAWLRLLPGQTGRFQVLSQHGYDDIDDLLAAALARLSQSASVFSLIPHYNGAATAALSRHGFEPAGDYVMLAKRLAKPAEEVVQETAGKAIPVS